MSLSPTSASRELSWYESVEAENEEENEGVEKEEKKAAVVKVEESPAEKESASVSNNVTGSEKISETTEKESAQEDEVAKPPRAIKAEKSVSPGCPSPRKRLRSLSDSFNLSSKHDFPPLVTPKKEKEGTSVAEKAAEEEEEATSVTPRGGVNKKRRMGFVQPENKPSGSRGRRGSSAARDASGGRSERSKGSHNDSHSSLSDSEGSSALTGDTSFGSDALKPKCVSLKSLLKWYRDVPPHPHCEDDRGVLERRQKQIDYGKNLPCYWKYRDAVPVESRNKDHPWTPNKYRKVSRRSFDQQIRIWKLQLHLFDAETPEGQSDLKSSTPIKSKSKGQTAKEEAKIKQEIVEAEGSAVVEPVIPMLSPTSSLSPVKVVKDSEAEESAAAEVEFEEPLPADGNSKTEKPDSEN